jgi:uncharacterized membrane protein YcaP (DUF421 family)
MFFDGWPALGRTLVLGVLAYASLVLLLRASGKRTLSKMNAFDFVVTVALGSTLATALLSSEVSLARALTAFAVLIGLQLAITWLSVRSAAVRTLVKAEPSLLVYRGELMRAAMKRERVTEDEVHAALREQGIADLSGVEAMVLETNSDLSVVQRPAEGAALEGLRARAYESGKTESGTYSLGPREA